MSDTTWACPRCTFSNHETADICEACFSGSPLRQSIATIDAWCCSVCTMENPFTSLTCVACEAVRVSQPLPTPAQTPSLCDDVTMLSLSAPGGDIQIQTEKQRYQTHLATVESYKKSIPPPAGLASTPSTGQKWKPSKDEDWCNTLVHGPHAAAACPKTGTWNGWKCIRCGAFYEWPVGGCAKGCSWREWGWVCVYHKGGYGSEN